MNQHKKYPEGKGTDQQIQTDGILCKIYNEHLNPNSCNFPILYHPTPLERWGGAKWPKNSVQLTRLPLHPRWGGGPTEQWRATHATCAGLGPMLGPERRCSKADRIPRESRL